MLCHEIMNLYKQFRLKNYKALFGTIREKDGSLSATEAYTADVVYLLEDPTVTKLAETLNISQPNATYKVNNLVSKGYVTKTTSEDDKRECHVQVCDRFFRYYSDSTSFIDEAAARMETRYSADEISKFSEMLRFLTDSLN